ncbi:spermidine/putrescine transport system substrate-binding protein [Ruminococcaceae bacterium YRB3002]|nr:spermidine/putrescine transport system substrate-binding protein [Ruminococcaceae bacterium YRB3002]
MRGMKLVSAALIAAVGFGMVAGTGCTANNGKRELTVINYGEYMDPDMIEKFTQETGIKINYEEALTPEELYTKYKSGAIEYDLVCSDGYMLQKMMGEGELQEIDINAMENKGNIGQKYWDITSAFDPGNKYVVPYFWGTLGILYDTTRVNGPVDSWDVLFNGDYKGEIIMQNSMRDTFMVALKYLGYSINTTNPDELRAAYDLLVAQKPDVQSYLVDEARDEVVAGNAIMAVVYSGEAYLGHEYNEDLAYVVPKEGSNIWVDSWAVTKNCKDMDAAMSFLDFLCREDVGMANFEYIYYSTPNDAVVAAMDEELREDEAIVPSDESTANCEVFVQTDDETTRLINDLWKDLKSK